MAAKVSSPPLQILAREPDGFSLWNGPPFSSNGEPAINLEKVPCSTTKFSENGSRLMVSNSNSTIIIYDSETFSVIRTFEINNCLAAAISPCGTYVQTFQKSVTPQEKNLVLWSVDSGNAVYQFHQKSMSKTTWPSIQFSADEAVACRLATNEIQFFDTKDFSKGFVYRLRIPGIAAVELSKAPGSHVAAFVAEAKGLPASIQIFSSEKDAQAQPVARRSFFRCSTVQMSWNHGSNGLLVVAQSDVDKTNQSYYGESKLNYLTTDGAHEGLVPLRKEGPVHDVRWSPTGSEFAVVYGYMPARATVFDKKCNPLLELGTGPYNTIRWNPKGKFICLAGFGNLPGDMAFWNYTDKKLLGATKAELSVTSEWSPDGRYFMTATTAPRLQVDNGIKIFHHDGSLYYKKMSAKLYQAEWKPEAPERFSDITDLAESIGSLKIEEAAKPQGKGSKSGNASANTKAAAAPIVQKPAAYKPPHAKANAAVQAQLFGGGSGGGAQTEELSKNALRNKMKREKQRLKKAAEAGGSSAT